MLVALAWGSLAFCDEIHIAAKAGNLEKVKALLNANPDLVNSKDTASYTEFSYKGQTPLHWAAYENHTNVVELLLVSKADVNARDSFNKTPLFYAASDPDVVKLLLANKADVNAKDNSGRTPLHEAAIHGHKDVAELLLAYKADVNATNNAGKTPLFFAVQYNRKDVADLLRQHGGL